MKGQYRLRVALRMLIMQALAVLAVLLHFLANRNAELAVSPLVGGDRGVNISHLPYLLLCHHKIVVSQDIHFYRVYKKKVDNFETALNLAKRLEV